jgi:murein DD-endopeptidase MepM/ murein hydrolase activator NlpD
MPEAKHPRGVAITLNYPTPRLPWPNILFLAVLAIFAYNAIAILNTPVDTNQREQWAQFDQQLLAINIKQQTSLSKIALSSIPDRLALSLTPPPPSWLDQKVKAGDTLSLIFKRAGYNDEDVQNVISTSHDGEALERIFPGQTIAFQADDSGEMVGVRYIKSPLETITYTRTDAGFESHIETRSPEPREAWTTGVITSSLFLAGQEAGLSQSMILKMANIFGGVVDFALDPRRGDTMELVYEELYVDGKKFSDGEIIAASFTNQGETFNAFRYTDANGETNYYNEEGVNMHKTFLMAPLDITNVSSDFNMHRMHPIYKVARPHLGTDYAAPTGTPVYAAGDGRVIQAGYNNTMGNFVVIQHSDEYTTKYLHLQKRMADAGQRVSQHQVIGAVGSTGAATGPHLHYEFLVNGVHHNPRTIANELPKANVLPKKELANFRKTINKANLQLAALRSQNHLAMLDTAESVTARN